DSAVNCRIDDVSELTPPAVPGNLPVNCDGPPCNDDSSPMSRWFRLAWIALLAACAHGAPERVAPAEAVPHRAWWKEAVVYQVYPRSFEGADSDGVGALRGTPTRLDYIKSLGVDVVWTNPLYQSPNDDNGYDISDYRAIMPQMGTMADFDALLQGMHQRGLKLIMDLVVNHSSDEHPWFQQS